jgi:predicted nucleotidyltransferase
MIDYSKMMHHVDTHRYRVLFATISGAHLYGFPSADSDFDLRGVHVLPTELVLGLDGGEQTVEKQGVYDGLEIDLVTHDVQKFLTLMLRRNGYVLEQLLSPLIVATTPEHDELKALAPGCITKHHAHHYLGFAASQWKLFAKESPPRVKPLLYLYRVLLTGINLMRTGRIEANLLRLNEQAKLPFVDDLLAIKLEGPEKSTLAAADLTFHESEYARLTRELEEAYRVSALPEVPSARPALNDWLVRLRLNNLSGMKTADA